GRRLSGRTRRYLELLIGRDGTVLQGLEQEIERHHLRQGGRIDRPVGMRLVQDGARVRIDNDRCISPCFRRVDDGDYTEENGENLENFAKDSIAHPLGHARLPYTHRYLPPS